MMHNMIDGGFGTRPHVVISVSNLERAVEFYARAFGLKVFYRDSKGKFAELTWDLHHPRNIVLWEVSSERQVIPCCACATFVAWESYDLEADRASLEARAVHVSEIEVYAGVRFFWVTDPDGNQLAIFQFMLE
jgi:predicted enzyme related to lactoylglutathione lyase